ncbi:MAG: rhodanese-like domain-containing protein [Pikeienuella sp.]
MPSPHMISIEDLKRLAPGPFAPQILDVRIDEDFAEDPRLIPGAIRATHLSPEVKPNTPVVTVCHKGAKLGQGTAALLRSQGVNARALTGGFVGWADSGGLLVPPSQTTRWSAPRGGDLSVLWLIRRYLSPDAAFLIVEPDSAALVAEKFNGELAPADFQAALEQFGLNSGQLDALARHLAQPSIQAVLAGLNQIYEDDLERLTAAMPVFDAVSRVGNEYV